MQITFIGAARTVTGSLHLFEYNNQKFILECGLYQGHREESERINRTFPFKPKNIKAVFLSHAHLDHSGNLPSLVKRGFSENIYCTPATLDITTLLLMDSAHIHENDIAYLNKEQEKKGLPSKEPLYTVKDAEDTIKHFRTVNYNKKFEPIKGLGVTFYDAGHILGSSQILLEIENKRILFSGDLGRKDMPIIKNPFIPEEVDYLILESTYGSRTHSSFEGMTDELRGLIEQGKITGSKIIIPSFAVERTQVLITMFKNLYDEGTLKDVPVYVDSPLATNTTDVFRKHPECFDEETYKIFVDEDPFDFSGLHYVRDVEESKSLNDRKGTVVIMSASGMCEGGRVLHHLIHSIEDEKNIIILTGFQASGTLGRKILNGEDRVSIFNNTYQVRAKVYFMGGLSGHADGNDLVEYVKKIKNSRLKKVFLVHGDIEEAVPLQQKLISLDLEVEIPQSLTRIEI